MSITKNDCRICGNSNGNKEHIATEMMFGIRDKFAYIECGECGCLQIADIPSNISTYYPDNYYSFQFKLDLKEKIKFSLKSFLIKQRASSSQLIKKLFFSYKGCLFIDFYHENGYLKNTSKVLDVGCGSGSLLIQLKYLGFKFLKGLDPFIDENIDYKNGVAIDKKYLHEVTETYDFIMMNHSFEHMEDPESVLKDIYRIIAHDGYASIRIPIASSFAWKHYGTNWVQLDAPRHFYLHTIKSMEILAKKTGLEIVDVSFDSTAFQFYGSEQYIMGIPLVGEKTYSRRKSSTFTKQQIKEYEIRAKQLNQEGQGDQACFILKKQLFAHS
jgi:2-polyprenyl-3-methyl-5-hydroxy-6-metoxy-1,4-benzoquinol methylase